MTTLAAVAAPAHFDMAVFLIRVAVLILAALLLGWCARAMGLPALAGELLAGVVLGPSALGAAFPATQPMIGVGTSQFSAIEALGQLGLLLLGLTGSATDVRMIRRHAPTATRISLFGLVIPFVLGAGVGFVTHRLLSPVGTKPLVSALFLGTALSVTAIPVIAKTLIDLRLAHRDHDSYTVIVLMALVTSIMAPPVLRKAAMHIDEQPWETVRLRRLTEADPQLSTTTAA